MENNTSEVVLKQRRLFETREFHLHPEHLRVIVKDGDGTAEVLIDYEMITMNKRHLVEQSSRLYFSAISFGIFSCGGLVAYSLGVTAMAKWVALWLLASIVLFAFHWARRKEYLLVDLTNDKSLFFLQGRPSTGKLERFLEEMYKRRRRYLRHRYEEIDFDNDPRNEIRKFEWLLQEGAISEAEFETIRIELL